MHIEFGSDIDTNANKKYLNGKNYFLKDAHLFRSGRDTLKFLAKQLGKNQRAFLPILCCDSMIHPFLDNGVEVVFYPLRSDYSIDLDFLEGKIHNGDLLLYINYLDLKSDKVKEHEKIAFIDMKEKKPDLILVDDMTQNLGDLLNCEKKFADYTIMSIRKWASIPDGGLLFAKNDIDVNFDSSSNTYQELKLKAMDLKSEYLKTKDENKKQQFLKLFNEANIVLDEDRNILPISEWSRDILFSLDFESINNIRVRNAKILKENCDTVETPWGKENSGPLYFPIFTGNQNKIQRYLASKSIYCPVLWPAIDQNINFSKFSNYVLNNMLAVPCDQRYSQDEMLFVAETINKAKHQI